MTKKTKEMTKVQTIIEEINHLNPDELELILKNILMRLDRRKRIESILEEYMGIGEGVWKVDAQEYVNDLRKEEGR